MAAPPLLDRHLIYVTGKGGVGKTTVAAALAMAAAARGRRAIVCELAEQRHMSKLFETVGHDREVRLAGDLYAISIDPQHALEEWLGRQVGGAALKVLTRSHAFQYFVAAAPGAKELITISKVWEIAQGKRWTKSNRTYDTVVVDAPASGHGLAMLSTPATFGDIARVGPIQRQAYKVRDMLRDPGRTGYVAVALPEEMPVNETIEMGEKLRHAIGLGLDAIVMNAMWPEAFTAKDVTALRSSEPTGGVEAALAVHARVKAQRVHLRRLESETNVPVTTLPFVFESDLELEHYEQLAGAFEA